MARTPGSNTVAYYPLDTNFNDYSGNGKNLTNSGSPTITTLNGVKCAYYNGSSYSRNTSISAPIANRTILAWIYCGNSGHRMFGVGSNVNNYGDYGQSGLQINSSLVIDDTRDFYGTQYGPLSGWHHVCLSQAGSTVKLYVDGVLKTTNTSIPTGGTSKTGTMVVVGAKANYSFGENTTGYVSNAIVENKTRTATEIQSYFNSTAWQYGLAPKPTILYGSSPIKEIYLGNPGGGRLPSAYQEVEYIQSSGTQWIDTGVIPKHTTKSQIKFKNLATTGDVIYGMYNGNDNADYRLFNYNSACYFDMGSSRINGGTISANTIYELELGNFYVKNLQTGSNIISGSAISSYTGGRTITLNNYGKRTSSSNVRYYVKIYDGTTLQRDFVPCYRKSDNVIGLYDLVEGKFYTNAGTGTFTKGANVIQNYTPIKAVYYGSKKIRPAENSVTVDFTTGLHDFTFYGRTATDVSYGQNSTGLYIYRSAQLGGASWKIPSSIYSKGELKKCEISLYSTSALNGGGLSTGVDTKVFRGWNKVQKFWSSSAELSYNTPSGNSTFIIDLENKYIGFTGHTLALTDADISAFNSDWTAGNVNLLIIMYNSSYAYIKGVKFYF